MLLRPNGKQYTTAAEDLRLQTLKKQFRDALGKEVVRAMKASQSGRIEIRLPEVEDYIDSAYYMGREDQGAK